MDVSSGVVDCSTFVVKVSEGFDLRAISRI